MMRRWTFLLAMVLASAAGADSIELRDGGHVDGAIRRVPGGWEVTEAGGKKTIVPDENVKSIEKGSPANPAEAAATRLASLRKLSENLSDPKNVVDRYEKFINSARGTPAADDARKDLDLWKKRADSGMIKIGDQWLTAEQQQAMLAKILPMIDDARELVKQSRMREADAAIARILAIDPKGPAGLYLKGLVAFKADRYAESRTAWEAVRDAVPDHAASLNNLGVLMAKQKQMLGALALYDQAMLASPQNRVVLDNVADALNQVLDKERPAMSYKKAAQHFGEQDAELQKTMKEKGLYRWGAGWVDADKLAELKAAEEKIKAKLDALAAEYDKVKDRIKEIDTQMDVNNRSLGQINNDRTFTDGNGRMTQLPPPSIYYKLIAENDKLYVEQKALFEKLKTYDGRAEEIKRERPVPTYTGLQKIIETDGVPVVAPGPAAVKKPTTRPGL